MSIYRKDNNGNIKKIAGLFIKTYNTKWFNVTRSIENDLEIYTLNNEDLDYFEYIQNRSIFNLNFTEPNTTTTPKLKIGARTFDIYSLINATGEIPVGILSSIVQFYFGATLDNNRVYINDYILLNVYNTQSNLDAVVANTKLISTENGGFKAGKDIITEEDGIGIGNNIEANHLKCITIGQNINNLGEKSLIIGNDSNNNAEECILIGNNNQADDYSAIVIGNNSSAKQNSIAIGDTAHADNNAVQLGTGNNTEPNSLQFRTLKLIDGNGNLYENNIKLSELYVRKTFLQNLYLSRSGALTANIVSKRPTVSSINYMTMSTTNTQLDYNSATKLTLSRVLQSSIQLTNDLEILVKLSFALNRNAQLEFGGRVLVDGVPISDNQAFGLNSYEGDSSYTGVIDTEFGIRLNLINEVQEFQAGQTLTVELFTRQVSNSTLVTRYYCGVNIGGVDRHSFIDINTITTSLDTNNIEDGAITTPKIANSAVTEEKLSTDVQALLEESVKYTEQTLNEEQRQRAQNNIGIKCCDYKSVGVGTQGWHNLLEISSNAKGTCFISHGYNYHQPFVMSFDFSIAVGYTYNITITASGQGTRNDGIYKLRFADIDGRYYIQLYFPHTQGETFHVAAYTDSDVYPCIVLDNTVTDADSQFVAAEIEVKNGINTTGNIYKNGNEVAQLSQVVRTDMAQSLTSAQEKQAQQNIGKGYSSLTPKSSSWIHLADISSTELNGGSNVLFNIFSANANKGLGWLFITYIRSNGITKNVTADYIDFSGSGITNQNICVINNNNIIEIYVQTTVSYQAILLEVISKGGSAVTNIIFYNETSSPTVSDSVTIKYKRYLSIDPTMLTPSVENGWSEGGDNIKITSQGVYYIYGKDVGASITTEFYAPYVPYDGSKGFGFAASELYGFVFQCKIMNGVISFTDLTTGTTSTPRTILFKKVL